MRGEQTLLSPFLREALDLLSDPADSRAPLFFLCQHGHHGLSKQVCVLPVAHHFLENRRERVWGVTTAAMANAEKRVRWGQLSCTKELPLEEPSDLDIL